MTKIQALKAALNALETDKYKYRWIEMDNCNCGILARELMNGESPHQNGMGKHYEEIENKIGFDALMGAGFAGIYNRNMIYCSQTGIELPRVFQVLQDAGFTWQELSNYESYSNKESATNYLKKWIKELEAKQLPIYIDISTSIAKEFKESPESVDVAQVITYERSSE